MATCVRGNKTQSTNNTWPAPVHTRRLQKRAKKSPMCSPRFSTFCELAVCVPPAPRRLTVRVPLAPPHTRPYPNQHPHRPRRRARSPHASPIAPPRARGPPEACAPANPHAPRHRTPTPPRPAILTYYAPPSACPMATLRVRTPPLTRVPRPPPHAWPAAARPHHARAPATRQKAQGACSRWHRATEVARGPALCTRPTKGSMGVFH